MRAEDDELELDDPRGQTLDLEAVLGFVRRRRKIMLVAAVLLSPLVVILPLRVTPVYESAATLVVQRPPKVTEFGADFMPASHERSPLARAAAILHSDRVLGPVVDRMGSPPPEPPGLVRRALKTLGLASEPKPLPPALEREARIEGLRRSVFINFKGGDTILEVAVQSSDPETATWLANAITDSFVSYEREQRQAASDSAVRWLSQKAVDLRTSIREKEQTLERLEDSVGSARLSDEAAAELAADHTEARLALQSVEREIRQLPLGPVSRRWLGDAEIETLEEYAAAREALDKARLLYTQTHPEIQRIRELLAELQAKLPEGAERERMSVEQVQQLRQLQTERGRLRARASAIEAQRSTQTESERAMSEQLAEYDRLERALEVERDMLRTLLKRSSETLVAAADETPLARVLDYAVPPLHPEGSRKARTLLLALLLVIGLAVSAGVAAEFLDPSVYDPTVVAEDVGVPLLGMIPKVKLGPRGIADPETAGGESFRHLRISLSFVGERSKAQTFLVTSAVPGEGKTTTAVNLAASYARSGRRTLLIDADLRRPRVSEVLGIPRTPGFTDLLLGDLDSEEVTHRIPELADLDVIPSGLASDRAFDLLGSDRMELVLSKLAATYDLVILDAPVLLSVSDAVALASRCDGVLFVSKPGSVSRRAFPRIADELRRADARVLGVVFTQVDTADSYAYPSYLRSPYGMDEKA